MKHDLQSRPSRDLVAMISSPYYLTEEKLEAAEELRLRLDLLIAAYKGANAQTYRVSA